MQSETRFHRFPLLSFNSKINFSFKQTICFCPLPLSCECVHCTIIYIYRQRDRHCKSVSNPLLCFTSLFHFHAAIHSSIDNLVSFLSFRSGQASSFAFSTFANNENNINCHPLLLSLFLPYFFFEKILERSSKSKLKGSFTSCFKKGKKQASCTPQWNVG